MGYPLASVGIGFGSTPYDAAPTFENVSDYVMEITTRRGRADELAEFDTGTATITLDNRDRRFDPLNTSGPYYGALRPRVPVRIQATNVNGGTTTTHDIFRGFISGWPVSISEAGYNNTVTIECFDLLGLLADEELPDDLADSYIRSLSPLHYWPLNDPIDGPNYLSQTLQGFGSRPQTLAPLGTFRTSNCDGLAIGLANTAVSVSETEFVEGWGFLGASTYNPPGGYAAFAIWFQAPQLDNVIIAEFGQNASTLIYYDVNSSTLLVQMLDGTDLREWTGTISLDLSVSHHLAVNTNQAGTLESVYIDAQPVTMTYVGISSYTATLREYFYTAQGRKQQAIVVGRVLTADEIKTIYQLSRAAITETTAARFQRLVDYSPLPATAYNTPTGTIGTVMGITPGGPAIVTELQLLNDSEGGNLYVDKSGKLTMQGRYAFASGTSLTSQATIGTTGITIGPELQYRIDADTMRNALTMGFAGEGVVEVLDQDSVDTYGTAGGTWSTQLSTQADAQNLGNMLVGFSKDPKVVVSPVEVNVAADSAQWPTVLGLELLDRITLTVAPAVGSVISLPQLVQSIEHRVVPGEWNTTLNGSTRWTNPFILDSSLLDGPDFLL